MSLDIPRQRLHNQHISQPVFDRSQEIVQWLGAVQAQDYSAAKWALGLRLRGAVDSDIEQSFTDGAILRTHLMRPTWHFVTPADIRWMLALTAPRVHALNAPYYRKVGLDQAILTRSADVMAKALRGDQQRTRDELREVLRQAGIAADGELRMGLLMMHAELEGIVCSGPRRGKQFTYMLLEERAPQARTLAREEALAEIVRRFFTSHGPAALQDFAKWSGLTTADGRAGLEMVKSQLAEEKVNGSSHWFSITPPAADNDSRIAFLLPNYDEYTVGYKDHSIVFDPTRKDASVYANTLVIRGRIAGVWKRTVKKDTVTIELNSFERLTEVENEAVIAAARQYGVFLGVKAVHLNGQTVLT